MEDQVENLQFQVNFLQERISDLETNLDNQKNLLRSQNKASDDRKIIQQEYKPEAEDELLFARK